MRRGSSPIGADFGFVARVLHEGGTQVEDERPVTLAEAMAALEDGLIRWFEVEAIDLG
jgi:hypothetical protein